MLLYQDSLITLEYDPSSDVVEVEWPTIEFSLLPEVKNSLRMMVETIRNYDVKRLLVDGRTSKITLPSEEHTALDLQLASDLNTTRLQKIARIQSSDLETETKALQNVRKLNQDLKPFYQLQNFTDRASAMDWLLE